MLITLRKRVTRLENHIDTLIEKFIFHHKFLGTLMIFIGMSLITLAAVCICTTMIAFPIAFLFGCI